MPTIIRTIETSNDGLDSFSANKSETTEFIKGELISTETEQTDNGTITIKTYADDVIIRKVDGVEVSRTNIKS